MSGWLRQLLEFGRHQVNHIIANILSFKLGNIPLPATRLKIKAEPALFV